MLIDKSYIRTTIKPKVRNLRASAGAKFPPPGSFALGGKISCPSVILYAKLTAMSMSRSKVAFAWAFTLNEGPRVKMLIRYQLNSANIVFRNHTYPGKSRPGIPTSNTVLIPESMNPFVTDM
jgi:hypothetical protein